MDNSGDAMERSAAQNPSSCRLIGRDIGFAASATAAAKPSCRHLPLKPQKGRRKKKKRKKKTNKSKDTLLQSVSQLNATSKTALRALSKPRFEVPQSPKGFKGHAQTRG